MDIYKNNKHLLFALTDLTLKQSKYLATNYQNTFDLVEKNIPSLLHYFPNTTFRSTIIPATVHNLYDNFIFAIQSGFTNYFATPNKYEAWSKEDLQILLDFVQYLEYLEKWDGELPEVVTGSEGVDIIIPTNPNNP